MLGELGGDMEDDYSLPQDVEEVYIPSTKDEELGGLFASTMQIADRDVNSYIQTSPGGLLRPQDLMGGAAAPKSAPPPPPPGAAKLARWRPLARSPAPTNRIPAPPEGGAPPRG